MKTQGVAMALALIAAVMSLEVSASGSPRYTGMIDVLPSSPSHIQLNPAVMLLPGESITFSIVGQVDVDHKNFEVRRCKHFGLKCWYEWRSVPHFVQASGFTVEFELQTEQGTKIASVVREASAKDITLTYPTDTGSISQPARIYAVLQHPDMTTRTPCSGRPRHCSSGALQLQSRSTEIEPRLKLIESALENSLTTLDPLLIRSDQFTDPLLIDSDERKLAVQRLFAEQMASQRSSILDSNPRKAVEIAKFALGLSSANAGQINSLNTTILEAYLKMGDFQMVTQYGRGTLESTKKDCRTKSDGTFEAPGSEACTQYAALLRLNAIGWLERRARYSSTEIRVALGMLETAIAALGYSVKVARGPTLSCASNLQACREASKLYIDGARMLTVLRTRTELAKAEEWLSAALAIEQALPADAKSE